MILFAGEPESDAALLLRARQLAGRTLGQLAQALGAPVPTSSTRGKGWAGQLVERALGGTAGPLPGADFPALGVELKTVPVDARGHPRESTFVTTLDLESPTERSFATSRLRQKLSRVLWVPLEAGRAVPLAQRRVGWAVLWSPSVDDEAILREDFEALVELHHADLGHRTTAHHGRALQLRPKGASAASLRWSLDAEGAPVRASPRAFYLRAAFTRQLLARAWIVPPPR